MLAIRTRVWYAPERYTCVSRKVETTMGDKHKAAHHRGAHQVTAKRITTAAYANPNATCATCHHTLDNCGPNHDGRNRNGTPCTWQAGHIIDGVNAGYQLECSFCNQSRGAIMGNAKRNSEPREPWP